MIPVFESGMDEEEKVLHGLKNMCNTAIPQSVTETVIDFYYGMLM